MTNIPTLPHGYNEAPPTTGVNIMNELEKLQSEYAAAYAKRNAACAKRNAAYAEWKTACAKRNAAYAK